MSEEQALYIIGIVAAWMQMGGYLPNGEAPNWKALEQTLCASKSGESAPSAIHNSGSTSTAEIADEMHAFAVKHSHGKPIYAVAHIERWSRQLRECR